MQSNHYLLISFLMLLTLPKKIIGMEELISNNNKQQSYIKLTNYNPLKQSTVTSDNDPSLLNWISRSGYKTIKIIKDQTLINENHSEKNVAQIIGDSILLYEEKNNSECCILDIRKLCTYLKKHYQTTIITTTPNIITAPPTHTFIYYPLVLYCIISTTCLLYWSKKNIVETFGKLQATIFKMVL